MRTFHLNYKRHLVLVAMAHGCEGEDVRAWTHRQEDGLPSLKAVALEAHTPTEEAPLDSDAHDTLGRGRKVAVADWPSHIEDDPALVAVLGRQSDSLVAHLPVAGHGKEHATLTSQIAGYGTASSLVDSVLAAARRSFTPCSGRSAIAT